MIEHFSTNAFAPAEKLALWNDLMEETYSGLTVDPVRDHFEAQFDRWVFGGICLTRPKSAAVKVERHIASKTEHRNRIVAHIVHSGTLRVRQQSSEAVLEHGDMLICSGDVPYSLEARDQHEVLVIDMSTQALADRLADNAQYLGRPISGKVPTTRLLHDFLLSLWREGATNFDPLMENAYADVVADLLAAALSQRHQQPSSHNPLLNQMKGIVEARIADSQLKPSSLAQELGVSLRTLQTAAAEAGTTPIAYITHRRLILAAQKLTMNPGHSITRIAFECGFCDSAYFARRFTEHFGVSPRQYRATH